MPDASTRFRDLTQGVSTALTSLRTTTPDVMKSFGELGRSATADGALDAKTEELIALALSVASRCDPCIGFHMPTLVKMGATRQQIDETLGVTTYMGGSPSLMYAASAISAFEEFSRPATRQARPLPDAQNSPLGESVRVHAPVPEFCQPHIPCGT